MIRCLLLFLLLQVSMLHAAPTLEQLAELTDSPATLKGDFKQKKTIKAFDASIISTGTFSYKRHTFIRWNTVAPVANQLMMTPKGMTSQQDGEELVSLSADKTPAIKMLSEIFFAVLTAEWETLANYFDVQIDGDQAGWQVVLTPKENALKEAVVQVNLAGDRLLNEVTLQEKNGDMTHILFSNLSE